MLRAPKSAGLEVKMWHGSARRSGVALVVTVLMFLVSGDPLSSQPTASREQLRVLVGELRRTPQDNALRERIIGLVLTIVPPPSIPQEAERYEGRAEYVFKNAKSLSNYLDAAREYENALLSAPWVANDYFNAGVAYEKGGNLAEAIRSFRLYLVAAPSAQDASDVRKRIGGLEWAMEKTERDRKEASNAEEARRREEAARQTSEAREAAATRQLVSGVYRITNSPWGRTDAYYNVHMTFAVVGGELIMKRCYDKRTMVATVPRSWTEEGYVEERRFRKTGHLAGRQFVESGSNDDTLEISPDGNTMRQPRNWVFSRVDEPKLVSPQCPQ